MTDDRMLGYGERSWRRKSRKRRMKQLAQELAPGLVGGAVGALFVFVMSGGALPLVRMALTAAVTGLIFFLAHRLLQRRGYR
jgi:hypothetical protein